MDTNTLTPGWKENIYSHIISLVTVRNFLIALKPHISHMNKVLP